MASGKKTALTSTVTSQDGEAEIAEEPEEPVDQAEHRLGDEIEPAPVDQQLEAVDAERVLVAVDDRYLLGAGEQPVLLSRRCRRRRTVIGCLAEIGLVEEPGLGGADEAAR